MALALCQSRRLSGKVRPKCLPAPTVLPSPVSSARVQRHFSLESEQLLKIGKSNNMVHFPRQQDVRACSHYAARYYNAAHGNHGRTVPTHRAALSRAAGQRQHLQLAVGQFTNACSKIEVTDFGVVGSGNQPPIVLLVRQHSELAVLVDQATNLEGHHKYADRSSFAPRRWSTSALAPAHCFLMRRYAARMVVSNTH